MASTNIEITGDAAHAERVFEKLQQKQKQTAAGFGQTTTAAQDSARQQIAATEAAATKGAGAYTRVLRELRKHGPEGRAQAKAIEQHMQEAGIAGRRSMTAVIDELKEIDPVAAAAAAAAKAELEKMNQVGIPDLLAELNKLGPEGREQAEAIKAHLRETGKDGRRSIEEILTEIGKIDDEAAAAAATASKEIEQIPKAGASAFKTFTTRTITDVAAIASGFLGVNQAVQFVNASLEQQEKLIAGALDKQIELAKAQQEAAKNLAGLSAVEQSELLQQAVPNIARDTGFSDVARITSAIGAAVSRGADANQAAAAVRQAARVERLTPDNLDATAGGAVAVQLQTGLADIRQAIALIQTTGTQAAITDPAKLIESLPKAVGAAVSTVREQNTEEAARQAAALFAQVTQGGNDSQGMSSATFTTDFSSRLGKFFSDLEQTRVDARSQLEAIENKKAPLERDFVRADELRAVIPQLEALTDPGTLFGRIEALQAAPDVASEFVGAGFGEKQFQVTLQDLLEPTSRLAQNLKQSADTIQANPQFFETTAERLASSTPQLQAANFANRIAASQSATDVSNIEGATLSAIRQTTADTLARTREAGLLGGARGAINEIGIGRGITAGSTAAEESVGLIGSLIQRRNLLERGGVTAEEAPKIEELNTAIEAIQQQVIAQARFLSPESLSSAATRADRLSIGASIAGSADGAAALREFATELRQEIARTNQLLEGMSGNQAQQTEAAQETAQNTRNRPDPATVQRTEFAAADSRGGTL